jgi:phage terminase Nu1 subunit (DNA packaging protein)
MAELLNLSEKRIRQLSADGIIEEAVAGHYVLVSTVQAYIRYLQRQISDDDATSDYNTEKAKLTKAKREDAEMDLSVKRGELHRAADVEFVMTNMLIAFKSKLLTMPHKVLPDIINLPDDENKNDSIVDIIRGAVMEALNELSGYDPDYFDEEKYIARLEDTIGEPAKSDELISYVAKSDEMISYSAEPTNA